MAWCPNPSCGNAFVSLAPISSVQCSCGMKFCFHCSLEAHEPCRCAVIDKWKAKCGNDSETANWILSNTKKCPVCSVRIEKNQVRARARGPPRVPLGTASLARLSPLQGCNHIICRSKGCGFEFCWVCLAPWSEHGQKTGGYYACNKFKAGAPAGSSTGDSASRAKVQQVPGNVPMQGGHTPVARSACIPRPSSTSTCSSTSGTPTTSRLLSLQPSTRRRPNGWVLREAATSLSCHNCDLPAIPHPAHARATGCWRA